MLDIFKATRTQHRAVQKVPKQIGINKLFKPSDIAAVADKMNLLDRRRLKELLGERYEKPFKYHAFATWNELKRYLRSSDPIYSRIQHRFSKLYLKNQLPPEENIRMQKAYDVTYGLGDTPPVEERISAIRAAQQAKMKRMTERAQRRYERVERVERRISAINPWLKKKEKTEINEPPKPEDKPKTPLPSAPPTTGRGTKPIGL